jgi:hypothetical protein
VQYAASPAFLTRSEFLNFCRDKFELGDTASMIGRLLLREYRVLVALAAGTHGEPVTDIFMALASNPPIVAAVQVRAKSGADRRARAKRAQRRG